MWIESKQKIKPVTRIEALTALWRVKFRLGQYPIHILWAEAERFPALTPGKTYWFGLSGENIPGIMNARNSDGAIPSL